MSTSMIFWAMVVVYFAWRMYMATFRPEQFNLMEDRRRERNDRLLKGGTRACAVLVRFCRNSK